MRNESQEVDFKHTQKLFWDCVDHPKTLQYVFWFTVVESFLLTGNWKFYWRIIWPGI